MSQPQHSGRAHARLNASSSHRWMMCPPSVKLSEQFADTTSQYAEEGTYLHELCELKLHRYLCDMLPTVVDDLYAQHKDNDFYTDEAETVTDEYVAFCIETIEAVRASCKDPLILVEHRLDYSEYVPEGFGTGDLVIVADGICEVVDFKGGRGVRVDAERNSQLMLYGLGAYLEFDALYGVNTVRMTIVQPRLSNISTYEISAEELLRWAENEVRPKAALAYSLHAYQKFCVDFIEDNPQCALFLDCGLGKTVVALTAILHLLYDSYDVSRVLIIAPLRVARDTWIGELGKWAHLCGLRMERIIGPPKERVAALSRRAELYIINRENVVWLVKHYEGRKLPFDMLVIDELSSFKNAHAKRFMALKKVIGQFDRVVGLTGTPAPNGLEDLWPQIFLLDRGKRLGRTVRSYLDMFFTVPNSWLPYKRELKPGAEQDIYRRLADICVSMRATDHIQMPERVDNLVELTLSPREEKLYKQMERDMLLPYADGDVLAVNAATLAGKLLQLANGAVYDEFHNIRVVHDQKLDALEDLIEAANGKPVLVLYTYKHDLQRIQERLGKWSTESPAGVRKLEASQDMADWNDGKILVAATQPASTGHGLNLQHGGSTIIWFGLSWSLELYEQSNARLWRQGQKDTVVIHHLVVKGTMDEQVMQALRGKAAGQNELLAAVKARIGGISDVGT